MLSGEASERLSPLRKESARPRVTSNLAKPWKLICPDLSKRRKVAIDTPLRRARSSCRQCRVKRCARTPSATSRNKSDSVLSDNIGSFIYLFMIYAIIYDTHIWHANTYAARLGCPTCNSLVMDSAGKNLANSAGASRREKRFPSVLTCGRGVQVFLVRVLGSVMAWRGSERDTEINGPLPFNDGNEAWAGNSTKGPFSRNWPTCAAAMREEVPAA